MQEFDDDLIPLGDALKDREWERLFDQALADVTLALMPAATTAPRNLVGEHGLRSARTLLAQEFGETPWLVDGLITEDAVLVIGGEPKAAKSWALVEIAIALATDTPVFGEYRCRNVDERGVFLFQPEDNERSVQKRIRSIMAGREAPVVADWEDRLWTLPMGHMRIDDPRQLATWVASIRSTGVKPALVGLDPLRDLHMANEDSSTEMQPVIRALRALRTVLGCAVAFVHHTGKATADSGGRRGGQRLRGSSALHGAIDAGFYMLAPERSLPEDGPARYSATIESEIKAAKSAGHFGLDLMINDNERGDAVKARWFVRKASDETEAKSKAASDGLKARVLAVVTRYARTRGGAPMSQRQIKAEVGVSGGKLAALRDCLEAMVDAGDLAVEASAHGGNLYSLPKGARTGPRLLPDPDPDPDDLEPPEDHNDW